MYNIELYNFCTTTVQIIICKILNLIYRLPKITIIHLILKPITIILKSIKHILYRYKS